jgi:ElaB/YqjD/DUF883 family membrane-anchored ribosome-binding protein
MVFTWTFPGDQDMSDENTATVNENVETEAAFYRKAREARDKLNHLLHDLGEKAGDTGKHIRRGVDQTEEQIKDHPWAAVGIAAGVGLLLGLLINRGR